MCGIFAVYSSQARIPSEVDVAAALLSMEHRGPDESYYHHSPSFVIGNNRLAITGRRHSLSEIMSAVRCPGAFNGEIYNCAEIAQPPVVTSSDTEVFLNALLESDDVSRLLRRANGQFAAVIHREGEVVAARDKLGIKPLYYGTDSAGNVYFSSEIRALANLDLNHRDQLRPGSFLIANSSGITHQRYYLPAEMPDNTAFNIDLLERLIDDAVRVRYPRETAPVGIPLSGGVDSTIVAIKSVSIAREYRLPDPIAYSVSTPENEDLAYARAVAAALDIELKTRHLTPMGIKKALPQIIRYAESYDFVYTNIAIIQWFTALAAHADGVRVFLSGTVADEIFIGYTFWKNADVGRLSIDVRKFVNNLHTLGLQVNDRMGMAHSIEVRVPYADTRVVDYALSLPFDVRMHRTPEGEIIEKWPLRRVGERIARRYVEDHNAVSTALESLLASMRRPKYAQNESVEDVVAGISGDKQVILSPDDDWPINGLHIPTVEYYYSIFREQHPALVKSDYRTSKNWFDVEFGRG